MSRTLVFDLRYATAHYPGVGSYAVGLARALHAQRPRWPWRFLVPIRERRFDLSFLPEQSLVRAPEPTPGPGQLVIGLRLRSMRAALYHSPFLLRPRAAGCPAIVTLHDVIPLQHPEGMTAARRALWRGLAADALRASLVVTDSEASRAAIQVAFPRAAAPLVIRPGHGVAASGEAWPKWPRPAVLTVGINKPHKNLETLVRAVAGLSPERRPLLVSAGPVDRRFPSLEALAKRHGVEADVRALGLVPEDRLAALYRSATLFAFPTRFEGFGLPLLEALALGVPAIASDLPVLREIAGDAARYCAPEDPAGWARAIAELTGDAAARATLARRGLERARAFDYRLAAEALLPHYQRLVPALGAGEAS